MDIIAIYALACEKNYIHHIWYLHITLSLLQVCIGITHCMHGCVYVRMYGCMWA